MAEKERLTARGPAGNAYFPMCFKEPCDGCGCTKDHCDFFDQVCDKLAGYEEQGEQAEQLMAKREAARAYAGLRHKLMRYEDAEQSGRMVELPFELHSTMLNLSDPANPEFMKDVCLYVAWKSSSGIVFHSPYNCFLQDMEKGYIKPVSEEMENLLNGTEVGNDKADSV